MARMRCLMHVYLRFKISSLPLDMDSDTWNRLTARANHLGLSYYDTLLQLARTGYPRENLIANYDVVKAYGEFPRQLNGARPACSHGLQS